MNRYLLFKLANDADERLQVKVDHIKSDIVQEDVKDVADKISSSNVFMGKKGIMTKTVEAKIVEITYTEFEV